MFNFEYKKQIQFLRGLSVLFVFIYHSDILFFNKGYLGVDIFFVISGFVITQRIFQDYQVEKKINLSNFYIKRFKRIIPNLFFIISVTYIIFLIFGPPYFSLWNEMASSLLGVSNFYYLFQETNYFNNIFNNPLGHTWSLGVEEQFYLIYPLLIFLIFTFKKNIIIKLKISFFVIFIFSLVLFMNQLESKPLVAFYFSPSRFWELIFGAILFFYHHKIIKNNYICFTSLFLIFYLLFSTNNYDYFSVSVSVVFLAGIFITTFEKSTFLENKYFVYFGTISYSFYLWHLPVIFFFDLYFSSLYLPNILLSFIVTLFLSVLTFHYIEQKFRYADFKNNSFLKYIIIVSFFILLFLIYAKYFNQDLRKNLRTFITDVNYLEHKHDWNKRFNSIESISLSGNKLYAHCLPSSGIFTKNSDNLKNECLKHKNYDTLFYVEGNSWTAQYIPILDQLNSIDNIYYKNILDYNISVDEINGLTKNYKEVIYVTNIENLEKFNKIIQTYPKFNSNIKFIFFNSTPHALNESQARKCLVQQINCTIKKTLDIEKRNLDKLFFQMEIFRKKNYNNVFIFNSYNTLCPDDNCKIYDKKNDLLFFRDEGHLAIDGTEFLINYFQDFIEQLQVNKNIYQY
tara:strand:- start:156 stop:2033 length:1878 start_codon:yes stop_codon:yes gene_type:complete